MSRPEEGQDGRKLEDLVRKAYAHDQQLTKLFVQALETFRVEAERVVQTHHKQLEEEHRAKLGELSRGALNDFREGANQVAKDAVEKHHERLTNRHQAQLGKMLEGALGAFREAAEGTVQKLREQLADEHKAQMTEMRREALAVSRETGASVVQTYLGQLAKLRRAISDFEDMASLGPSSGELGGVGDMDEPGNVEVQRQAEGASKRSEDQTPHKSALDREPAKEESRETEDNDQPVDRLRKQGQQAGSGTQSAKEVVSPGPYGRTDGHPSSMRPPIRGERKPQRLGVDRQTREDSAATAERLMGTQERSAETDRPPLERGPSVDRARQEGSRSGRHQDVAASFLEQSPKAEGQQEKHSGRKSRPGLRVVVAAALFAAGWGSAHFMSLGSDSGTIETSAPLGESGTDTSNSGFDLPQDTSRQEPDSAPENNSEPADTDPPKDPPLAAVTSPRDGRGIALGPVADPGKRVAPERLLASGTSRPMVEPQRKKTEPTESSML